MIIPDYEVGQYVHLKPFQGGAKDVRSPFWDLPILSKGTRRYEH